MFTVAIPARGLLLVAHAALASTPTSSNGRRARRSRLGIANPTAVPSASATIAIKNALLNPRAVETPFGRDDRQVRSVNNSCPAMIATVFVWPTTTVQR
jgi:hypothetical protein